MSAVVHVIGIVLVVVVLVCLAIRVRQNTRMTLAASERELLESPAVTGPQVEVRKRINHRIDRQAPMFPA